MARDWSSAYAAEDNAKADWSAYLEGKADAAKWPKGLRAYGGKLYRDGRLLIPSSLELEYLVELQDQHHASTAKTAPDLTRRTWVQDAHRKMAEVRRHCQTCQAAAHRNRLPEGKLSPHPVPPRPFASVGTDIFAHVKAKDHRGDLKDKIVLVTCRHTSAIFRCASCTHVRRIRSGAVLAAEAWCRSWSSTMYSSSSEDGTSNRSSL